MYLSPSSASRNGDPAVAREETALQGLINISKLIDRLNDNVGKLTYWLTLIAVLVSSGNATVRYLFDTSSNAWLELQWYLFSAVFLLCGGYALLHGSHVRIDVVYARWSRRTQLWIDVFGTVVFLLPMAILILYLSWPVFMNAFMNKEVSSNAGGLIVWPARLLLPVGFFLLVLQGFSELIKRLAILQGLLPDPALEDTGPSAEEELAQAIKEARERELADAKTASSNAR
jgi:TRAP-type mannitol/chloroaromatic compound transport system permease small subunit